MRARSLLLDNLSWKLLSIALALLIWSGARLFMHQEVRPLGNPLATLAIHDFRDVPVRILSRSVPSTAIRMEPASVFIRVGGDPAILSRLTERDALVYVELPSAPRTGSITNRVEVRLPSTVRVMSVVPQTVVISPMTSP